MKLLIVTVALAQRGAVDSRLLSTIPMIAKNLPGVLSFAVCSPNIRA